MSLRASLFAAMYDRMSRKSEEAGVSDMRDDLLAEAGGHILEIGGGTGANLSHYGAKVESLVVTEPDDAMLRRLQDKAREQAPLAKVVQAPAENLPFEDASFDIVVSTLVLCGVDDQERSLRSVGGTSNNPPSCSTRGVCATGTETDRLTTGMWFSLRR